jgi:hypothetical protein
MGSNGHSDIMSHSVFKRIDWNILDHKGIESPFVPDDRKLNFDARYELEEILLEENPLHAKPRKRDPARFSREMALIESEFKPFDYSKLERCSLSLGDCPLEDIDSAMNPFPSYTSNNKNSEVKTIRSEADGSRSIMSGRSRGTISIDQAPHASQLPREFAKPGKSQKKESETKKSSVRNWLHLRFSSQRTKESPQAALNGKSRAISERIPGRLFRNVKPMEPLVASSDAKIKDSEKDSNAGDSSLAFEVLTSKKKFDGGEKSTGRGYESESEVIRERKRETRRSLVIDVECIGSNRTVGTSPSVRFLSRAPWEEEETGDAAKIVGPISRFATDQVGCSYKSSHFTDSCPLSHRSILLGQLESLDEHRDLKLTPLTPDTVIDPLRVIWSGQETLTPSEDVEILPWTSPVKSGSKPPDVFERALLELDSLSVSVSP